MWCFLICCIKWFFKTYSVFLFNFFSRWFIYLPSSSFKLVLTIFHSKLLKEKLWSRMEWNRKAKNPWNKTQSLLLLKSQHFTSYTQTKHRTGEGNGTPLQYSYLENPMDGGAWWAAVHGAVKSRTQLKWLTANANAWASLVAQTEKNPPAMRETWVRSLGWKDSLERGMATHSSILAWRIPMDRGAWRATVDGVAESDTTERLSTAQQWFSIKSESALPHSSRQCMEMCSTVPIWGPAIPFFSQYNLAQESQSPTHILPTPDPFASFAFPSLPYGVYEYTMKETCPIL